MGGLISDFFHFLLHLVLFVGALSLMGLILELISNAVLGPAHPTPTPPPRHPDAPLTWAERRAMCPHMYVVPRQSGCYHCLSCHQDVPGPGGAY
jgi:hypothetical protein